MIQIQDDAGVRRLVLNRPPANSLTRELIEKLQAEIRKAQMDPAVRCLVLASALPKYFSAGLELAEVVDAAPDRRSELFKILLTTHRELAACPKPTVASIGGTAILGGWILAMGCDVRLIAAETGRIALSEIKLGLSPSAALISRLLALGGDPRATRDLVLRGRTLRAEEALAARLVDRVVPQADLEAETASEAKSLARLPPTAYAAVKKDLARAQQPDASRIWEESLMNFERLLSGAEAQEGLAAMREKRKPRWEAACS